MPDLPPSFATFQEALDYAEEFHPLFAKLSEPELRTLRGFLAAWTILTERVKTPNREFALLSFVMEHLLSQVGGLR